MKGGAQRGERERRSPATSRLHAPHPLRFDGDQSAPLAPGSDATPLRLLHEIYLNLKDAGNATRMATIRNLDPQDKARAFLVSLPPLPPPPEQMFGRNWLL